VKLELVSNVQGLVYVHAWGAWMGEGGENMPLRAHNTSAHIRMKRSEAEVPQLSN